MSKEVVSNKVIYYWGIDPVLYTVGLQATFCNMNSSVWAIWAVLAVRKKSGFEFF